jgi:hypothetical protein
MFSQKAKIAAIRMLESIARHYAGFPHSSVYSVPLCETNLDTCVLQSQDGNPICEF